MKNKRLFGWPNIWIVVVLLFGATQSTPAQTEPGRFNREPFYAAFISEDTVAIQKQLKTILHSNFNYKGAYAGALIMKKAGLIKGASRKLKEFKSGKEKLEEAIREHDDVEFRFLRLVIQEKAPKVLGYHKQLEEDRNYLIAHFQSGPAELRKIILDYSKSSSVLSPGDF